MKKKSVWMLITHPVSKEPDLEHLILACILQHAVKGELHYMNCGEPVSFLHLHNCHGPTGPTEQTSQVPLTAVKQRCTWYQALAFTATWYS